MRMGSARTQWVLAAFLVVGGLGALAGYVALRPHEVPAPQRALLALNADNLGQLQDAFNAGQGHTRVIAFLSPT
jgi:hypothetical protein